MQSKLSSGAATLISISDRGNFLDAGRLSLVGGRDRNWAFGGEFSLMVVERIVSEVELFKTPKTKRELYTCV